MYNIKINNIYEIIRQKIEKGNNLESDYRYLFHLADPVVSGAVVYQIDPKSVRS